MEVKAARGRDDGGSQHLEERESRRVQDSFRVKQGLLGLRARRVARVVVLLLEVYNHLKKSRIFFSERCGLERMLLVFP